MKKIFKISSLFVLSSIFVFIGFTNTVYGDSVNITQINFTSFAQSINTDTLSGVMSVQTQNASGTIEQTSETNHLIFSSSSSTGEFYNANSSSCTTALTAPFQLTLSNGGANKNFCYKDSTAGTHTITVSADGQTWTSAVQEIVINGTEQEDEKEITLSSIAITTPATKLNYTVSDSLDITGLVVTGTYSDESTNTETITTSNITGFDSSMSATDQVLTITVGDKTITYIVNISTVPTQNITLKVYSGGNVLFDGPKTVIACAESLVIGAPITFNGRCAIEQSGLTNTWTWYDINFSTSSSLPKTLGVLEELGGSASDNINYIYWGWFSNLDYGTVALNKHVLVDSEELLLTYNSYPLRISASKTSGVIGDTIIFTAEEESTFNPDPPYNMIWTPSKDATITLGAQSCITITDGTCSIVLNTVGIFNSVGSKTLYVPSANLSINVSSPGGGGNTPPTPSFSVPNAISYLKSVQSTDGSFGNSTLYSDWTAIAFGAYGVTGSQKDLLLSYFNSHNSLSSLITDNERRAMALLALGQNPYSYGDDKINYIKSITDSFDGTQLGDVHLDNDDIFGLIVLSKTGYTKNDEIISKTVSFVLSAQVSNGSWDNSIDMTAASIQALKPFEKLFGVSEAIEKAKDYLAIEQQGDGGWGNASSTSWVMQAGGALGTTFSKNGKTGLDYLASLQTNANNNGSVLASTDTLENNIWATSYAVPAGLDMPWGEILQSVEKPSQDSENKKEDINKNSGDDKKEEVKEGKQVESEKLKSLPDGRQVESIQTETLLQEKIKPDVESEVKAIEETDETDLSSTLSASAGNGGTKIPVGFIPGILGIGTLSVLYIRRFF